MTPEEAAHLGGTITGSFLAWEELLPLGVRRMFGGDRVLLLCATFLVPHVRVRLPLPPGMVYGRSDNTPRVGTVSMPALSHVELTSGRILTEAATAVAISSADLILAAAIVLAVDRLDARDRADAVPEELRAAASVALMLGLEIVRV